MALQIVNRVNRVREAWKVMRALSYHGGRVERSYPGGRRTGSGLTSGGLVNTASGMGTGIDKSEAMFFTPTYWYTSTPIQTLCIQSFAARKAVNIIPRDMFLQRRRFRDAPDAAVEGFEKAVKRYRVDHRIMDAMITGRQYGTGLLMLMTAEAPLDTPLEPERIRTGDLKSIRVFHRFDVSVRERDREPLSENFMQPEFYDVYPTNGRPFRIHASRCFPFHGMTEPSDSGFVNYDRDWGLSILIPLIVSILQEAGLAQAAAHLVQEASVPVLMVSNLRDTMAGRTSQHDVSVEEIGEGINRLKSIFRLMMLDKETEQFTRVAVQFAGLADLFDRNAIRVAAGAEIPATRFWGTSPKGMNATGEHDMENYIITFEATRANELPSVYEMIDEVVARSEGIATVPEYDWPSLLDLSEKDTVEIAKLKADAIKTGLEAGLYDEDEARAMLDGDPVFGPLEGPAPEPPEPEPAPVPPMPGGPAPGPQPPAPEPPEE